MLCFAGASVTLVLVCRLDWEHEPGGSRWRSREFCLFGSAEIVFVFLKQSQFKEAYVVLRWCERHARTRLKSSKEFIR